MTPTSTIAMSSELISPSPALAPEPSRRSGAGSIVAEGESRGASDRERVTLEGFILNIRQSERKPCSPRYYAIACSHAFHYLKSGCMNRECPECCDAVSSRRASRARKRLEAGRRGRAVCYTVLTVPPELREAFLDRKTWRAALKAMFGVLRSKFGAEFAVECSHPWGDKDPSRFHPHANFLWVSKAGAFLSVEHLQKEWANVLGSRRLPVVWHQYSYEVGKIAHLARYVTRDFPGFSEWCGSMRWYGDYPARPDIKLRCPVCGSSYVYLRKLSFGEYIERVTDDAFP